MFTKEAFDATLNGKQETWLVTGGAGFIGSNLVETLLRYQQKVVVLDNLATGYERNLNEAVSNAGASSGKLLTFVQGDIRNRDDCAKALSAGVTKVLHQAALGSVPRSIKDPMTSHDVNVNGFVNVLEACRDAQVRRIVYASSSSVYGDSPILPKSEPTIGDVLSPYAATKRINEVYAGVWSKSYDVETVGLRYFNVFGARQDPHGAYAAVIPKWISTMLSGENPVINGDGLTSRDFCYIDNTVQANLRAALVPNLPSKSSVLNVAYGGRTTLKDLLNEIIVVFKERSVTSGEITPIFGPFRAGDIAHSNADISLAKQLIGYAPQFDVSRGLREAMSWYLKFLGSTGK